MHQCCSTLIVQNQLTDRLQGVCLPIREVVLACKHITTYEILKLFLLYGFLRIGIDNTTRTDVIVVSQELSHVGLYLSIGINLADCLDRRLLQTYVIIVCRSDNGKL